MQLKKKFKLYQAKMKGKKTATYNIFIFFETKTKYNHVKRKTAIPIKQNLLCISSFTAKK
jgi:hypothetical protein